MDDLSKHAADEHIVHGEHETSDADVKGIAWSAVGLTIGAVISMALMFMMLRFMISHPAAEAPLSPVAIPQKLPADLPKLEVQPYEQITTMHAREDKLLNQYGWVDEKAGVVRIPVDRAMDLVLERGLPTRGANAKK